MPRIDSLKIKAKLLQKAKKKAGKPLPLKDAFEIIAKSSGFESWRAMKATIEKHSILRPSNLSLPYWNNWYSSYEEAKKYFNGDESFLLPYENQFFICGVDYIETLGIESSDSDLELVGRDWAKPKDIEAYNRILEKISAARKKGREVK